MADVTHRIDSKTDNRFSVSHHVKISCIEDIINRQDYRSEVDVTQLKLVEVVEPYHLPEKGGMHPCGIKTCKTRHYHGFLVKTSDGNETNIGKDCGKKHFPGQFNRLSNQATARYKERTRHQILNKALDQAYEILKRVETIKSEKYGASWLNKSKKHFLEYYPDDLCAEIKRRAGKDNSNIEVSREREKEEIDDLYASNPSISRDSLRYTSEVRGQILGLKIFNKDIRKILVDEIQGPLRELINIDPATVSKQKTNELYSWYNELDQKFSEVDTLLNEGRKFFQLANIRGLRELSSRP